MISTITSAQDAQQQILQNLSIEPANPVITHWLSPDFPTLLPAGLLKDAYQPLWVVGSKERTEVVVSNLRKTNTPFRVVLSKNAKLEIDSGIATVFERQANVFDQPTVNRRVKAEQLANATKLAQLRDKVAKQSYNEGDLKEAVGVVTIISAASLNSPVVRRAVSAWAKPVIVLDHLTDLHCRWKNATDDDSEDAPDGFYTRRDGEHIPYIMREMAVPSVYLLRDEWASVLVATYVKSKQQVPVQISTKFEVPDSVKIAVWTTEYATSAYDGAAFLALATPAKTSKLYGSQLVANGIHGCVSPARLSISATSMLTRAVMKVSAFSAQERATAREQCPELGGQYIAMRIRDQIRAALLSFDARKAGNELVVLAAPNVIGYVRRTLPDVPPFRLPVKPYTNTNLNSMPTLFQDAVGSVLTNLPQCLLSKPAKDRILSFLTSQLKSTDGDVFLRRMVRVAHGLTSLAGTGGRLNWFARPEATLAVSPQVSEVVQLVELLLDHLYPWSLTQGVTSELASRRYFFSTCNIRMEHRDRSIPCPGAML